MNSVKKIKNLTNEWIDDEEDIAEDKRDFLGNDGVNIFSKKSGEKTVEERIKTSRTLKIKNNKWNQVDYTEDFSNDKITIDPHSYQYNSSYEYVYFEQELQKIIENSKYKELLLGEDKQTISYQTISDIVVYCYPKLKQDYTMAQIFVYVCEYCGVSLQAMWKRLSTYLQIQILEDLKEVSKLPNEILNNNVKLF